MRSSGDTWIVEGYWLYSSKFRPFWTDLRFEWLWLPFIINWEEIQQIMTIAREAIPILLDYCDLSDSSTYVLTSGSIVSHYWQFLQVLLLELFDLVFFPCSELLDWSLLCDLFFLFCEPCSISVISDLLSEMLELMSRLSTFVAYSLAISTGLLSVVDAAELFFANMF